MREQLHLSAALLVQWQHQVASTKALDLLHWAMHAVLYRRTAVAAINMAGNVGPFFAVILFSVALAAAGAIRSK
jgi:hypothetical protein